MSLNYLIEVAVLPGTSTTERGRILEKFSRKFLETQNYSVQEEVRLTATEVDLLGTEKTTGEKIFVECKAHRSTIAAEVLTKLLGNVYFGNYSSGWLLSTFALGKDAKGFEHTWNEKPPEERRKLRIYAPESLVERLILSRVIADPGLLAFDNTKFRVGTDAYLLLTQNGEFWALPVIDPATGIRSAALLFSAETGKQITDSASLDWISRTDTSLAVPWISDSSAAQAAANDRLQEELETIVRVPMADKWADYRPARPEDFVGREAIQEEVFRFFDAVRGQSTRTRLIALKGPSGWGKSSSVLKIAARAANIRNRGKYFVFTVDSRAATTSRFPELAVLSAVRAAAKSGFIKPDSTSNIEDTSSAFSMPTMLDLSRTLAKEGKLICVFFDQFEELLYKADLAEVFTEMRRLCAAVEDAQANLVIGFSWKTDGVIPTEHNAYHMWHELAEHRNEIELSPFTENEVTLAINRFAKELGQPVIPQLRRLLQDHCQGFPWLLKKLCVHILELAKSGIDQVDILNSSINIQSLFKKDVEQLSSIESGCIKQIALESPAEFFKIAQNFGDDVISLLVNKRLVIRSGTKLTIYWDIFRDYILTDRIPYIPVTYVPQANFSKYANALAFMAGKSELTYAELGDRMVFGEGATDNLVRDLANLGHVENHRKKSRIVPLFSTEKEAISIAFSFWRSHDVVRRLYAEHPAGTPFLQKDFEEAYRLANKRAALGEATHRSYMVRILGWLRGLGMIAQIGNTLVLQELVHSPLQSLSEVKGKRSQQSDFFLGEAPPTKVVAAVKTLAARAISRPELEASHGRNTCYVLVKLGLMRPDATPLIGGSTQSPERIVAMKARNSPTVRAASELLKSHGSVSGLEFGEFIAARFGTEWSQGSLRRHGTALRQWAEWSAENGE